MYFLTQEALLILKNKNNLQNYNKNKIKIIYNFNLELKNLVKFLDSYLIKNKILQNIKKYQ